MTRRIENTVGQGDGWLGAAWIRYIMYLTWGKAHRKAMIIWENIKHYACIPQVLVRACNKNFHNMFCPTILLRTGPKGTYGDYGAPVKEN